MSTGFAAQGSLEKGSFIFASIGLGLCIASTEALRYSAHWYVASEGLLSATLYRIFFLTGIFAILLYLTRSKELPLYQNHSLLITIALLQTVAFMVRFFAPFDWGDYPLLRAVSGTLLESSYFLFIVFASYFLTLNIKTAIEALVVGVIVAGTLQICITFLSYDAASALILLYTPLSCIFLAVSARRKKAADTWLASLPATERKLFEDERADTREAEKAGEAERTSTPLWQLYLTIALSSLIVAAIHIQWLSVQDRQVTSTMIQVCAGVGTILAGNLFLLLRRKLEDRDVLELSRFMILPIAIGTLYVATLLSGSLLVLAVIPLNITYVAILFLAWIAPFVYKAKQTPLFVSTASFFAKKIGVVAGLVVMRDLAQEIGTWVVTPFVATSLFLLIVLGAVYFFSSKKTTAVQQPRTSEKELDSESLLTTACMIVSDRYRLTPREKEVLELLVKGRTAGYIAEALFISSTTAKTHIKHIYQKTGVQSKQSLLDIVEATGREYQSEGQNCAL